MEADIGEANNRICEDYDYTSVINWRQQVLIEYIPAHVKTATTFLLPTADTVKEQKATFLSLSPIENSKYCQRAHQLMWRLRLHLCWQMKTANTDRVHQLLWLLRLRLCGKLWKHRSLAESILDCMETTIIKKHHQHIEIWKKMGPAIPYSKNTFNGCMHSCQIKRFLPLSWRFLEIKNFHHNF